MFKTWFCVIIVIQCLLTVFAEETNGTISNVQKNVIPELKADLQNFDMRYSTLPTKCGNYSRPKDCTEATACSKRSGVYMIKSSNNEFYYVECNVDPKDGDWLVIQRRQDGSVDFYRDWLEYEQGFGNIDGEFFIGLKKLHQLTNYNGRQELMIIMDDYNLTTAYAKYDNFSIGNATESYALKSLGNYSGTAGDSLGFHLTMNFSTWDRDNDQWLSVNCAELVHGAWWYNFCLDSNLNSIYQNIESYSSIIWRTLYGDETPLKYVKMLIRRHNSVV